MATKKQHEYWLSLKGRKLTDEHKRAISKTLTGFKWNHISPFLEAQDYIVIRFKGSEILNNFQYCKKQLIEVDA